LLVDVLQFGEDLPGSDAIALVDVSRNDASLVLAPTPTSTLAETHRQDLQREPRRRASRASDWPPSRRIGNGEAGLSDHL
jgi:hypothetical protein